MFIKATAIRNCDDIDKEYPFFLNLDTVESIDLIDGKMIVFYKNKDSEGEYFSDTLKNSLEEINKKLKDVGVIKQ